MSDRELLAWAAKASGLAFCFVQTKEGEVPMAARPGGYLLDWNPLEFNGDAFKLAAKLDLFCDTGLTGCLMKAACEEDPAKAARRVFVEAAALIGRQMEVAGE